MTDHVIFLTPEQIDMKSAADQMAATLRQQAKQILHSDHPERVWFHKDALNTLADLEAGEPTPGVIAHASGAIEFYNTILNGA